MTGTTREQTFLRVGLIRIMLGFDEADFVDLEGETE